MSERLPVLSGERLVQALTRAGWQAVRQRGSHVRIEHAGRGKSLTVPLRRELGRATLSGVLRDAGLDAEGFRRLL